MSSETGFKFRRGSHREVPVIAHRLTRHNGGQHRAGGRRAGQSAGAIRTAVQLIEIGSQSRLMPPAPFRIFSTPVTFHALDFTLNNGYAR